ncbi:MAG TPA: YlmC/YmxH family sporulation protein [Firmicutes bacterium]|nr:YlmC/YmxH family sporulation protein [Bacillota bacterium]
MQKASDLRLLEVINIADGRRLGHIYDVDMDAVTGEIISLILPGSSGGFLKWSRKPEIMVNWNQIVRIGEEVILVHIPAAEFRNIR